MIQIWTRSCDHCGLVKRIIRSITSRAPRGGLRCDCCCAEHPVIEPLPPWGDLYWDRRHAPWTRRVIR